jgi:undecaprenyl pyrophosphate phosphatase UppP
MFVNIIVPIALFAMVFGIVYVAIISNYRQNISMIEAGMNPKDEKESKHSKLRNGLLLLLVPIGILIGNLLHDFFDMEAETSAVVFAFLFGGMAMVATYFIERNKETK